MSLKAPLAGIVLWAFAVGCSSSPLPTDAGQATDSGHFTDSGTTPDAGMDAGQDAGPPGLTCGKLLQCDQNCPSDAGSCTDTCYAESTAVAQGLFDAFDNCLNGACPSTDGGACADPNSQTCSNCDVQAATGACVSELQSCSSDSYVGPPNPDGGAVIPDAGGLTNCGQLITCLSTCAEDAGSCVQSCDDQATPEARALDGLLYACLAEACPITDGGPCASAGTGCNGCIEQAEFGGNCSGAYRNCESDTSNSGDAGIPTALNGGTLATVFSSPTQVGSAMLIRDGYLYFSADDADNQVYRINLMDGGTPERLGPVQPIPVGMAVDSNNVYVWNYGTFSGNTNLNNNDGTAVQIPLDGGPEVVIGQGIQVFYSAPYLNSMAIDQNNIYWVDGASGNNGRIWRTPLGTDAGVVVYDQQNFPEAILSDGTDLFWANWGTFDAQGNSNNDGTISQGTVDGGSIRILASGLGSPANMAMDSRNIYWTNLGRMGADNLPPPNGGSVMQAPIGGGPVITLASEQSIPMGIAVDAGMVYWTVYGLGAPGLVMSVPVDGGTPVPLVAGLHDPYSLVLGGDTLYFSFYLPNIGSTEAAPQIISLTPY
jgi:hypothetical protein